MWKLPSFTSDYIDYRYRTNTVVLEEEPGRMVCDRVSSGVLTLSRSICGRHGHVVPSFPEL
jgi:hypothetical protein